MAVYAGLGVAQALFQFIVSFSFRCATPHGAVWPNHLLDKLQSDDAGRRPAPFQSGAERRVALANVILRYDTDGCVHFYSTIL
jgi:hypothetical protein